MSQGVVRPDPDGEGPPARSTLRLVLDPLFGRYFFGRMLSSVGVWIHNIVAALFAFELTGSAFVVGLVSVAQFLPQLVLAPLSGMAADRGDRRRQVIAGRYVVAAGSGGIAAWLTFADVSDRVDSVALILSALVVGLGFVTGGPAMHAMVPGLVRPNEIAAAVTLNMVPVTMARAAGPVIGVAIALGLGPAAAFATAAVCNVGFALALLTVHLPPRVPTPPGERSFWGGFTYLRVDPTAARLLLGITAVGLGADPAITLAPSISAGLGHGSTYAGAFASAFGIGAGLAFLVIPAARRSVGIVRYGTFGLFLMAVGQPAVVLAGTPHAALPAFAIAGIGMTLAVTSLSSQLQERLPDHLRGRVMALWSMAFLGSRPVAAATNGAVADHVSVTAALLVVMALMLAVTYVCRPARLPPA